MFITGDKEKISQNTIFKSKRLTITHPQFTDDILTRIISEHMVHKRKVAVYFDNDFNCDKFIEVAQQLISPGTEMKIYIAKGFRKDVTSPKEIEMVALNKHKQLNHADANRVIEELMSEIYKPNLKSLVRKIIGRCDCKGKEKQIKSSGERRILSQQIGKPGSII